MIKAISQSKWYWYIPIVSIFFLKQMSSWIFAEKDESLRGWKLIVVDMTIPLHVISIIFLLLYFHALPLKINLQISLHYKK